jgi:hypothetical protein
LEKTWLCSQDSAQSGCTGLSGGAPDSVRCARLATVNWLLSGSDQRRTAINHWTVWWCTGLSGEPMVGRAKVDRVIRARRVAEPTVRRRHRTVWCALNSVRCANGSGSSTVDCATEGKEIRTGHCPVVHHTVRCARQQKARIAFLECSQRLLDALGL